MNPVLHSQICFARNLSTDSAFKILFSEKDILKTLLEHILSLKCDIYQQIDK
jgi:hypothetical protein